MKRTHYPSAAAAVPSSPPVLVIALAKDGRTYISNSIVQMYDNAINRRLSSPDWHCYRGPVAGMLFESLWAQLINDEIAPVGFFTRTPMADVLALVARERGLLIQQLQTLAQVPA